MHIFFGRINENQDPKDQFSKAYYYSQKGTSYFGELNKFDSFIEEDVYVFMIGKQSIELWKATHWGPNGTNLYFEKTGITLGGKSRAWFAAFKFFYLDADLIVFTTRRPFKKAFFRIQHDDSFTEAQLLNQATYDDVANYRSIELHDQRPAYTNRNIILYKEHNQWKLQEPEFWDRGLTQYFRDNSSYVGKGRVNKDSILEFINTSSRPVIYNPDHLSLLNVYDVFFCDYKGNTAPPIGLTTIIDGNNNPSVQGGTEHPLNTILYGPPGTGKTYSTLRLAAEILTGENFEDRYSEAKELFKQCLGDQIDFVTFHQNYSYEDFVAGLRPDIDAQQSLLFKEHRGIFYRICQRAKDDPENNYVLIIDEINRANISRVFGELITLLEPDKRLGADNELKLKLPGLPEAELFSVPGNLYLIGTMNTADKSIALIDIALRRRFVFIDMYPRPELIDKLITSPYNEFLKELNGQILTLKGPDFLIGHAYFIAEGGKALEFENVINQKIIPLLNEYFYNQKNNTVYTLLQKAITKVPGYRIEADDYLGVICKL